MALLCMGHRHGCTHLAVATNDKLDSLGGFAYTFVVLIF